MINQNQRTNQSLSLISAANRWLQRHTPSICSTQSNYQLIIVYTYHRYKMSAFTFTSMRSALPSRVAMPARSQHRTSAVLPSYTGMKMSHSITIPATGKITLPLQGHMCSACLLLRQFSPSPSCFSISTF